MPPRRPFEPEPDDDEPVSGPVGGIPRARPQLGWSGPPRLTRRLGLMGTLIAVFVLIAVFRFITTRGVDWLWFRELGFERVFLTTILAQWALFVPALLVSFGILYANARVALGAAQPLPPFTVEPGVPIDLRAIRLRLIRWVAPLIALGLAVLLSLAVAGQWRTLLSFWYRTPFGQADPIFGRDIGFYVFTLPLLESAFGWLQTFVLLSLVAIALPVYMMQGEIGMMGNRATASPRARRHLATLLGVLLLVIAAGIPLVSVPRLLLSRHAPLVGASYTDLQARYPALLMLGLLAGIAGATAIWGAWRGGSLRATWMALGGFAVAWILGSAVIPGLYQRLVVQPNELTLESPQILHHIAATRRAWALDSVDRRELSGERGITMRDIAANRATIDNVRLWDREPLLQTFGQLQSIRTYYEFVAVDDDRYMINGQLRQVMLSARELDVTALPTRTFINEHLTFTHGMGITLGPTNQVTAEGLPVLFVKDLPPVSSIEMKITRPQIYFGELANDFLLAPTRQKEFDFPAGEGDQAVYSSYAGKGGVRVGGFLKRALFALHFGAMNILLSRDLTDSTRILYYRNVTDRARRTMPFLRFDHDPYLVVRDDGKLTWMLDAYTTTDRFPYAQPLVDGTTYMRNSVKVVIDAYDGDVQAFLSDAADPLIRTWMRIYPGLIRPLDQMPADLRRHVRYPEDLFRAQTALFSLFHMNDPETFYHREDQWQIPGGGRAERSDAFIRHIVMRLPGEQEPEFILMRPFTPRQKDNLAAWMVARSDGEHYGKLVVYRFPRQSLVFGPTQVVNRINQDTEVARQITLWDQRGSEVIRGELLVIPIEQSLIYVQPIYLRAQGGRIPELKRVIVAYQSQVVMEETLEAGLTRLFGSDPGRLARPVLAAAADSLAAVTPRPGVDPALLREALERYDRARAALRADDWATYGTEMRRLGELLRRLNGAPAERP